MLHGNGEHILLIEDEKGVLDLAIKALEQYGYSVCSAQSGRQAENIYSKEKGNFDLSLRERSR
ncbi:MAG: hypothetical protein ABIK30_11430 [bacterium]